MSVHYGTDIFLDNNKVLVIPTNCVGAQGAGLALYAAKRWPAWSAWYTSECRAKRMSPAQVRAYCGDVAKHAAGVPILVSVATKDHWRNPSRLEWIERGLNGIEALLTMAREQNAPDVLHGRNELGMGVRVGLPALGCGYGEMDYALVKERIEAMAKRLSDLGYLMRLYEPKVRTTVKERP